MEFFMRLYMLFLGLLLGVCGLLTVEYIWFKNQLKQGYSFEEIWNHFWGEHLKKEKILIEE